MTNPYDLPRDFRGFVIAEIECAVCGKDFITAVRLDNFLGAYGGSFYHYPENGGCGCVYSIVGAQDGYIIANVIPKGYSPSKAVAYYIGIGEPGPPIPPESIGWTSSRGKT